MKLNIGKHSICLLSESNPHILTPVMNICFTKQAGSLLPLRLLAAAKPNSVWKNANTDQAFAKEVGWLDNRPALLQAEGHKS